MLSMQIVTSSDLPEPNEVTFAEGRLTNRTYASRSSECSSAGIRASLRARMHVHRAFDEVETEDDDEWDWTRSGLHNAGRAQAA